MTLEIETTKVQTFEPSRDGAPVVTLNLPEADYHAQVGQDVPLLSYSRAKTIIQKSPYHAFIDHPLLGGKDAKPPTKEMDRGSLIHSLLLGAGPSIVVVDADSFRTKDAREARDSAQAEGKIPVLAAEYQVITEKAIPRIREQIAEQAHEFFDERAKTEMTIRWNFLGETPAQCRIDLAVLEIGITYDLKTTTDASENAVTRKIYDMGYDIQECMYSDALTRLLPDLAGRIKWGFIFVEAEDPWMVSVVETDSMFKKLGEMRATRAASIWRGCLESGIWPGYGRTTVTAPAWAFGREEAENL